MRICLLFEVIVNVILNQVTMDPFSITVGAVGITIFAVTSISYLHDLIQGLTEATDLVQEISCNLEAIKRMLSTLEAIEITDVVIYALAKYDIERAGVAQAVNSCGLVCNKFVENLKEWTRHSKKSKLSRRDKISVGLWNKEKVRTLRVWV